jgi:hypothetical protein
MVRVRHLLVLLMLVTGCSPSLAYVAQGTEAFVSTVDCTQGPLELHGLATGARWGERWILVAVSPRSVQGQVQAWLDAQSLGETAWATTHTELAADGKTPIVVADPRPENQRCVDRPVERVNPQGPPPAPEPPMVPQGPAPEPRPEPMPQPAQPPEPVPPPVPEQQPVGPAQLVPVQRLEQGTVGGLAAIGTWSWTPDTPDGLAKLQPGQRLTVRLWSKLPNDLRGVVFFLRHEVARPQRIGATSVTWLTDEQWLAFQHEERAARLHQAALETIAQDHQQRDRKPQAGHRDAMDDSDPLPPLRGGWLSQPPAQTVPQPHEPQGPPPTALVETPPPPPSDHAEWIAGYWQWTGFEWFWLYGWWRVPEADRSAGLTQTAPETPPALRVELQPPPPFAGAVWIAGWWTWDARIWLWVPGAWRLPPPGTLRWHAPRWIPHGVKVRLDPGGWSVELR